MAGIGEVVSGVKGRQASEEDTPDTIIDTRNTADTPNTCELRRQVMDGAAGVSSGQASLITARQIASDRRRQWGSEGGNLVIIQLSFMN